ncbi:MAG: TonB family protein [Candidatus Kapabacteria bacterium]|jgi:TonB family protein|nr:TonB family protein [Candidatus Kapabacteria bacterium]
MNLEEYFTSARREKPPLHKDEVSSILAEKVKQRSENDDAHRRSKSVFPRGAVQIFSFLSPKGWIMLSMLTSAVVALMLLLPTKPQNARVDALSKPNTQITQGSTNDKTLTTKNQTPNNQVTKPQATNNQAPSNQVTSNQQPKTTNQAADSLPAPYDFVPVDDPPIIDVTDLKTKITYPEAAKKLGIEGKVNVRVLILPNGKVSERTFIETSDARMLDSAALKAVFNAKWIPAKHEGKAVACWVSMPLVFRNPERTGTKAVSKAQMLTLTENELKNIGVELQEEDIIQILGWKKSREDVLQMRVSIASHITPKLMEDSVFTEYVHNLRKQGKYSLAAEWERIQWEHGKRSLHGLYWDSTKNSNKSGLATIVSSQKQESFNSPEFRQKARQFSLPRLVTDGHNYRYFVDLSDFPFLVKMREATKKVQAFYKKSQVLKMDTTQILDSLKKLVPRPSTNIYDSLMAATDSLEKVRLSRRLTEEIRKEELQRQQEEQQFEQEKSDISKLIGIRITSKQARSEGDEYLLWYEPTPEFIALLPERYRVGLEREVEAAKKYATKCDIPTEEERKAVPGYFDSWRSCDGTLKITSIFPNPADVQATVRFTLQEARSITITVHNLNGERLAILAPTPVLPAGEHELPLDFTGRNIGVYLLALSTDKNETAIKRVMIVR